MATLHMGTITGTSYDDSYQLDPVGRWAGGDKILTQTFAVTDLSDTSCTGPAKINEAISVLEANGYFIGGVIYIGGFPHRLSRRVFNNAPSHNALYGTLVYNLQLQDEIYFSVDTSIIYETTSWYPRLNGSTWEAVEIKNNDGIPIDVSRPFPVRTLNITRILYGSALDSPISQAQDNYAGYVSYVNSDTFCGLGKGYWKIDRIVSSRRPGGSVQLDASLSSKLGVNWMTVGIPQNPVTNRPLLLGATALTEITKYVTNTGSQEYTNNVVNSSSLNPATVLGFYPLTSFYDIFGFSEL